MQSTFARVRLMLVLGLTFVSGALLFANKEEAPPSPFARTTIDLGTVCSDVQKSLAFYKDGLGFTEADGFDVPKDFATDAGLTNGHDFHVHVLVQGDGESATKLKLMQFKGVTGKKSDQSSIEANYGFRYLTVWVRDLNASLERAAKHGIKPIAKGPMGLPEGFPKGVGLAVVKDPDGNFVELVGPLK